MPASPAPSVRGCLLLAALALAVTARPARATTAAEFCGPAVSPCVIDLSQEFPVDPRSTLNFGSRPVILAKGTILSVPDSMTLLAGSLTLQPGAALLARGRISPGGTITIRVTGDVQVQAAGKTRARIDVSAEQLAGTINITAGGDIDVAGVLAAQATGSGSATALSLSAGGRLTIESTADVNASGGRFGRGGAVVLNGTGAVTLATPVDASGGSGGSITISSLGDVTSTPVGKLDVDAIGSAGEGGGVAITAGGSITLLGSIMASASGTEADGSSPSAGSVMMTANGSLKLFASVACAGAPPDAADDVYVDLSAGLDLEQDGPITIRNTTSDAAGGTVMLAAGRFLTLGLIDVGSRVGDAAELDATGATAVTVNSEINGDAPGQAATIDIEGPGLTVVGNIHANSDVDGVGGDVTLVACTLTLTETARLDATGGDGTVTLEGDSSMTLAAGSLVTAGGTELDYSGTLPVVLGRVIPDPDVVSVLPTFACPPPPPGCGNRHVDPGEDCDDGNAAACDGCSATCHVERCGNGVTDCREECDDGNQVDGDGCDTNCTRSACGNGVRGGDEQCDDGNLAACDGCSPDCRVERCGNGVLECAEECDAGSANGAFTSNCDATCHRVTPPSCGNGDLDPGEQCDDGNKDSCDGCSSDCRLEECGNNVVDCGEQCDDANTDACDGCSSTCQLECGDHVVECTEECDDGNQVDGDGCDHDCTVTRCGNGVVSPPEECDDGNQVDGDGCDANCTVTRCGNGIVTGTEQCDDGNQVDGDGCDHDCTVTACGNGIVTRPEQCDDGNRVDEDTCDNSCRRRVACPGGFCLTCAIDTDCDPGGQCNGQQCVAGVCTPVAVFACNDGDSTTVDRCFVDGAGTPHCRHLCTGATNCDDDNVCTTDACGTAGACVHTPVTDGTRCGDDDVCNGVEACQGGTCTVGPPPTGYTNAGCSLDAIDAGIAGAAPGALRPKVARKLASLARTARKQVNAAVAASAVGNHARERHALGQATKALTGLEHFVGRGQLHGRIPDAVAEPVIAGLTRASDAIGAIKSALRR